MSILSRVAHTTSKNITETFLFGSLKSIPQHDEKIDLIGPFFVPIFLIAIAIELYFAPKRYHFGDTLSSLTSGLLHDLVSVFRFCLVFSDLFFHFVLHSGHEQSLM